MRAAFSEGRWEAGPPPLPVLGEAQRVSSCTSPPPPFAPRGGARAPLRACLPGAVAVPAAGSSLPPALLRPARGPAPSFGRARPFGPSLAQGVCPLAPAVGQHRTLGFGAAQPLRPNTFGFRARARTRVCLTQGSPVHHHATARLRSALSGGAVHRSSSAHAFVPRSGSEVRRSPLEEKTGIARTRRRSEACNPQWSGGRAAASSGRH